MKRVLVACVVGGLLVLAVGFEIASMERDLDRLEVRCSELEAANARLMGDLGICRTREAEFKQAAIDQGAAAEKCWSVLREKLDWSKEVGP